jgi:uncharacterized protein with FMN-binding domain
MSGTYWSVGDKVNIKQTDIEIKCEGSDEFSENQVIGIFIPPSVSLYSGKDTTLNFDVLIEQVGDTPAKCVLDSITGANGLFSKCVVYAGNRTQVIETLDHYSSWCSVKYSFDTNDSMRSRRAVVEGCGEWLPSSRGTLGTEKSVQSNHMYSPYVEQGNKDLDPTTTITAKCPYTKASVSIPIHMGLFANNMKAVPNMLMNGTYLELTCESHSRVFRTLDSTALNRKQALNPVFYGIDTGRGGWAGLTGVVGFTINNAGATYNDGTFTNVATTTDGNGTGLTCDIEIAGGVLTTIVVNKGGIGYNVNDSVVLDAGVVGAGDGNLDVVVSTIGAISQSAFWTQPANSQLDPQHSPFQVGQKLKMLALASTLFVVNAGTLYTDGTYTDVATTTSGAGSGMTLNITIAGGILTSVQVVKTGTGYAIDDEIDPDPGVIGAGNDDLALEVDSVAGSSATFTPALEIVSIEDGGDATRPIKYNVNATSPDVDIISTTNDAPEWVVYSEPTTLTPSYKLSNVRLVVRQLEVDGYEKSMMSKMKSGGKIMYDVPSVACVLSSATKGELQTSLSIPCEHSKARSIVSMPTDNEKVYTTKENCDSATTYLIDELGFNPSSEDQGVKNHSDRSGVSGIGDYLSSYNYIIDQKITPSRKVHTNKSSSKDKGMNMDHVIELEKSLQQSHGATPRSFSAFKSNFCIGRALTLDPNTIYDGRGKDIRLVARYEESTQPQHNKLWKHFISHTKTLMVEGADIQVQQ